MLTGNVNPPTDFNQRIVALYQVVNCVYWLLEKQSQRDEQLFAIVKNIRTILDAAHVKYLGEFPDRSDPTQALVLADVPRFLKPIAGFMRGGATQRELEVLIQQYSTDFLSIAESSSTSQLKPGG